MEQAVFHFIQKLTGKNLNHRMFSLLGLKEEMETATHLGGLGDREACGYCYVRQRFKKKCLVF